MFYLQEQSTGRKQIWRQRLIRLGLIWTVWTLVGLFFSSQLYFISITTERPMPFSMAFFWQVTAAYLLALATPPILWLARRFRLERFNWRRSLLVHILASILFAIALSAGHAIIDALYYRGRDHLTLSYLSRGTIFNLDKELLIYWLIVLSSHAISYYKRYREGELKASQAQLQALKMQLHPHFLFNALHSISTLVHRDPEAADKMIARLGDFLRLTLENSGTQEVYLKEELEFLKCYLEIERIRFSDRLTTHIEVDPQALYCRVPNLILQPIVENAVRYGIAPRSTPGRIEIKAVRKNGKLRLQVKDNGPGLSTGLISGKGSKGGYGLANTQARLDQLYGAAHKFELANDPNGGLIVTLEIPYLDKDEKGYSSLKQSTEVMIAS